MQRPPGARVIDTKYEQKRAERRARALPGRLQRSAQSPLDLLSWRSVRFAGGKQGDALQTRCAAQLFARLHPSPAAARLPGPPAPQLTRAQLAQRADSGGGPARH